MLYVFRNRNLRTGSFNNAECIKEQAASGFLPFTVNQSFLLSRNGNVLTRKSIGYQVKIIGQLGFINLRNVTVVHALWNSVKKGVCFACVLVNFTVANQFVGNSQIFQRPFKSPYAAEQ